MGVVRKSCVWDRGTVHELQRCRQYVEDPEQPDSGAFQTHIINKAIAYELQADPFFRTLLGLQNGEWQRKSSIHGANVAIEVTYDNWGKVVECTETMARIRETHLIELMAKRYVQELKLGRGYPPLPSRAYQRPIEIENKLEM